MTETNEHKPETNTPESASTGTATPTEILSPAPSTTLKKWNRKIHIYLGMYMLLFLWVFSLSGLFMNNPMWFTGGQPDRVKQEAHVNMPESGTRLDKAWDIMRQLNLRGEVYFMREPAPGTFGFLCMRPNVRDFVTVQLDSGDTAINHVTPKNRSIAAIINQMHVFTGNLGERQRDWLPTKIWSFSMDALAIGLIVLVLSSLYMGWHSPHRIGVVISFVLGMAVFAYFMWVQAALA
ncbi:hypothetical protein [Novipirellula artificiosorum]|uniref:PepSY-associated TM helix n=1 Tax=Novipirellula artificiosorum TaxID=2528016 RepID=A0A5C6E5F2_9BACT|nr:hypothetical protein [Novipirellula artificiosorum]TWU42379.1 hypothetical protein Poly41_06760 [Novipirellula artificiosorum]